MVDQHSRRYFSWSRFVEIAGVVGRISDAEDELGFTGPLAVMLASD
jgi:hypothetical protein